MAPATSSENPLLKRYYCNSSIYSDYDDCYSSWNSWGRWVALVVIVVAILVIAFLFSCINSRRRRKRGMAPMYGTGWIPAGNYGPPQGQGQQYGNQQYGNQQYGGYYANKPYNGGAPAPPYSPPVSNQQTGTSFNTNEGYYGSHQTGGIELQPPQNVHTHIPQRGGDEVYEAPLGPPPSKKGDAIIR